LIEEGVGEQGCLKGTQGRTNSLGKRWENPGRRGSGENKRREKKTLMIWVIFWTRDKGQGENKSKQGGGFNGIKKNRI